MLGANVYLGPPDIFMEKYVGSNYTIKNDMANTLVLTESILLLYNMIK